MLMSQTINFYIIYYNVTELLVNANMLYTMKLRALLWFINRNINENI